MLTYEELIKNLNVLIADDDEDYLNMTYGFLKQLGYNVDRVTDGKQALDKVNENDYQILLLDYYMPILNGEEVVREVRKTNQELIIILQTGFSGQNPPIETMQNLNIQNYHDKTEGIDRLNLELISAVKIFNQQNEIELTRYKSNAIGTLISGVAQEIKSTLMNVSGQLEVTNMIVQDPVNSVDQESVEKLNSFYENNKLRLDQIDKVLSSIIGQSLEDSNYIMTDDDVMQIIKLIVINDCKLKGVKINFNKSLRTNSYLTGSINDTIFVVCEILNRLIKKEESGAEIDFILTEDEANWYFNIENKKISEITKNEFYLLSKIILSIRNANISKSGTKITISMDKTM